MPQFPSEYLGKRIEKLKLNNGNSVQFIQFKTFAEANNPKFIK